MGRMPVGRFAVEESDEFPTLDILVGDDLLGKIDCLAVEDRVKARREETGDNTLTVTEDDIEWALKNARMDS